MNAGDLYYLARRLQALSERALGATPEAVDAVPRDHQLVLGFVLDAPGSTVGEISRGVSLAQSAVSTAVAALREQGLLTTHVDPDDRRRTRVSPSDRLARWAAGHLRRDVGEVLAPVFAELGTRERAEVTRALSVLLDALRRADGVAAAPPAASDNPTRTPTRRK